MCTCICIYLTRSMHVVYDPDPAAASCSRQDSQSAAGVPISSLCAHLSLSLSSSPSPASLPYSPYSAAMGAHRAGQRVAVLTPLMLAASAVCGAQNTAAGFASPLVGSQTTGQMQFIVHKPPLFRLRVILYIEGDRGVVSFD